MILFVNSLIGVLRRIDRASRAELALKFNVEPVVVDVWWVKILDSCHS